MSNARVLTTSLPPVPVITLPSDDTPARGSEESSLKADSLQRAIFNSANFSSIATDAKGVIQIFNVGAERMLGYSAADVVNRLTPADISDPQELVVRSESLSAELNTPIMPGFEALVFKASRGIEDIYELTYIRKDGSRFPAVVSVTALHDEAEKTIGYLLIGTDNTARQKAEMALRASEVQFEAFANALPQLCWMANAEGGIFWYNTRWYDYTGTTLEDMAGWGWMSVHDPAELPRVLEGWSVCITAGTVFESVFPLRGADGLFRTFLTRVAPIKDADEKILRWFGTNTDITDRMQAEAEIRRSDEKLRRLVAGVKDHAIFMLDPEGFVSSWNEGAEAIKGYRAEDIVGRHLRTFYTPEQVARGEPERQLSIAADEGHFEEEALRVRKDGSTFLAEIVITALHDEDGKLRGFGKVTRDITARKQAEADTSALLRTIHLHSIVSVADRAGRIIEVNDSFCEISGYSRTELIGKTHEIVNSGTHSREFWTEMWQSISNGRSWRGEICNRSKDGSLYWVDSIIAPFLGEDGKTIKFISIRTDITAAKLYEYRLRDANRRIALATEGGGIGIWELEMPLGKRTWSPKMFEIFGVPDVGFPPTTEQVELSCHSEDRALVREQYATMATGRPFHVEFRSVRPDGEVRWIETSGSQMIDDTTRTPHYIGVARDVTERKRAEESLRKQANLLDLSHDTILERDLDGRIRFWNHGAEEMYGYSRDEAREQISHQLLRTVFSRPLEEIQREFLANGRWEGELGHSTRGGKQIVVASRWALQRDKDGRPCGVLEVDSDITAAKHYEDTLRVTTQKAEEANRAKSEFLANMSHEIRTPMNAIIGMTHLARRAEPSRVQDDYLATIADSSVSLLQIINDILDFSKIEAGMLKLEHIPFSLGRLLMKVQSTVAYKAAEKGLKLNVTVASDVPPSLIGDPLRLEQILINLVSNAIKFSERGKVSLTISCSSPSEKVTSLSFLVRDSGIGMSKQQVSELFQPFNQGDSSTTRRYGGTGLGLAITKQLCELLQGTLSVQSEPSRGSDFLFAAPFEITGAEEAWEKNLSALDTSEQILGVRPLGLPLRDHTAEPLETGIPVYRPGTSATSLKGKRVLLVEDNSINRRVATELLIDLGITVSVALHGKDAVDQIQAQSFDLVLMDIQMPVMDGLSATTLIRNNSRFRDLPIIAMTAHAMSGDREKSLAAGMTDHLTKPISPERLTETLLRWMPADQSDSAPIDVKSPTELRLSEVGIPIQLPPFDIQAALARMNGKPVLLRTILFEFRDQFAGAASDLRRFVDEGNVEDAERLAHTLKSVSAMLEAYDLTQASTKLEAALHVRQANTVTELIAILEKALDPAIAAVDSLTLLRDGKPFSDGHDLSRTQIPKRFACILLIDDDPATVSLLNDTFQSGYDVLIATEGFAGLDLAAAREPDLILLDVSMTGVDGFEVCRRFKADSKTASIPIIFITGAAHLDAEIEGLKLGAADYLAKPLNTVTLKAKVDNHVTLKWAKDKLTLHAAEQVAASYERFNAVLESTSDSVMTMDRDWRVLYFNSRALKASPDLRVGENYWTLFPALLGTNAEHLQRDAMTNRTEEQYQFFYPPYERWYQVKVFPVAEGISVFFTDITAEKKLEDQLALEQLLREKRIEALSHMAGGLAHEISNPLAIIHGRASDLILKAETNQTISAIDVRFACDNILKTCDRATKILRGLKGFAREGAQDVFQLGSIYQIIDQCVEIQANRSARHLIEVRRHVAEGIPDFMCREVQIEQILTNLLNNAFDAIVQSDSRERWISLTALFSDEQISIDVTDSGPGIEEHYKDHLMEPFFTTKGVGLGMGVGLSLSRVIAEDHGGTLTMRKETKHTTFRLVLPIAARLLDEYINATSEVTY